MIETGESFSVALAATRAGNIFTTHTPVDAGFDRFSPGLIGQYLGAYAGALGLTLDGLLALGRQDPGNENEPLNMAYLASRGVGHVNGVSRLHGEVSRRIFQTLFPRWPREEVPISYVTNGIHTPSWDSAAADMLWSKSCGKERWLGTLSTLEDELKKVPDEALWALRTKGREQLVHYVRERLAWQLEASGASAGQGPAAGQFLNPHAMTIGFARRFATYKRPNLLLYTQDRLIRILCNPKRPVQFIIAGKAHPRDEAGKEMILAWSNFISRPEVRGCVFFLADYDMVLAEQMVQGVDLWVNTPRRPWEACGTSGMKVLVNGGLNLSELDGWWAEAYSPEVGWALGDGREHGTDQAWDAYEADRLYGLLEEEVIPCFYERNEAGFPTRWISRMRKSMAELTPRFSTNRMLREYVEDYYLPAGEAYRRRSAHGAAESKRLSEWQKTIERVWPGLRFEGLGVQEEENHYTFTVAVGLGELDPGAVAVQLYAEPLGEGVREIYSMMQGSELPGKMKGYQYRIRIPARRPAGDYTPRIIPAFGGASVPLEAPHILWYR
jgi:starch phosphorylase